MYQVFGKPGSHDAKRVKGSLLMVAWIFAWSGSMVLADKAELFGWYTATWMPIAGIVVNGLIGIGMIFAYLRFLGALDDLQRKIQVDALAIALGVTLVGSYSYSLMTTSGFITDPELSDVIVLTMVTYSLAVVIGLVRYR